MPENPLWHVMVFLLSVRFDNRCVSGRWRAAYWLSFCGEREGEGESEGQSAGKGDVQQGEHEAAAPVAGVVCAWAGEGNGGGG